MLVGIFLGLPWLAAILAIIYLGLTGPLEAPPEWGVVICALTVLVYLWLHQRLYQDAFDRQRRKGDGRDDSIREDCDSALY